ncbi:hypothetical protein BDZ45DRAFT_199456 [Acephala macrosclerotiorum]|nr:hypothetical protein BDZ45DRAFT_199456 [Acephala macrosclerotiorum]
MATSNNPLEPPAATGYPSHKRTSSAAENTQAQPQIKRQAQEPPAPKPQIVYVVMIDDMPMYNDRSCWVQGVYATLKDANNAVKRFVNSEYDSVTEYDRGVHEDGRVYWSSHDTGEGDRVEIEVEEMEVRGDESDPEIGWDSVEEDLEGEDDEEDEEEDEEEDDDQD